MEEGSTIRKRFEFNKKYLTIAIYAFVVIALAILLEKGLENREGAEEAAKTFSKSLSTLVSPFGFGFLIAYLMNPIVIALERKVFSRFRFFETRFKAKRRVSIICAYLIYAVFIVIVVVFIAPEITNNASNFIGNISTNYNRLLDMLAETLSKTGLISKESVLESLSGYSFNLQELFLDFSSLLQTVLNVTLDVVSMTLNLIMGIFISFYLLDNKENFLKQLTKIIYVVFREDVARAIITVINRTNIMFRKFVLAKAIDSLIIGIAAYVGFSIMNIPLAMLLGVIIGVTNMIPYFGPFIGAIPAILIVMFIDPTKAFLTFVFILALQQFDGNFLGPKLMGNSIGINPVWIIFAIIIGGAIGGPIGMFLGVPIFASFKSFFDEFIEKKYNEKFVYGPEQENVEHVVRPRVSLVENWNDSDRSIE